jgi:hypothetical protein
MSDQCSSLYSARDAKRMRAFNRWFAAAMLSFFAMTVVLSEEWLRPGAIAYGLTGVTIAFLFMAAWSYLVFLRNADELLRKIPVEALALSFAAGGVFMLAWRLCERLGAHRLDVDDPFLIMMVVWGIGQYAGYRRYSFVGAS